jgi:formate dehydrogenase beta subunit
VFKGGVNLSARRGDGPDGKWGWCWPLDRRVLYNRASADPDGKPWSERKKLVWWDDDARRWVGDDIPDFPDDLPPDHVPPPDAVGAAALRGDDPFVLQPTGRPGCSRPTAWSTGPMPTHYEPDESPVRNPLHGPRASPTRRRYDHPDNPANPALGTVFPFVLTSSRLTEHYTSGAMTRTLPFLAELQPELFVEVSPQLAAERGLVHGQWCHVVTTRTAVQARAVVTERIPPLRMQGTVVHQVWMPYHFGGRGLAKGDVMNDLLGIVDRPQRGYPGGQGGDVRRPTGPASHRQGAAGLRGGLPPEGRDGVNSLFGPLDDVAGDAGHVDHPPRVGFFTDTSVCIGCKACEVACKQWNGVPAAEHLDLLGMSHDNTGDLGANAWRHVAFVEQSKPVDLGMPAVDGLRWLMASDVCKHCTHAGCLDVCPTGALFRTEFGSVVVQQDICNGCGYCVSACPYGVIERRPGDGRAQKCTLCYDRLSGGLEPACAKACPTDSIQFGELDELRERAAARVETLHERGETSARLYGDDSRDGVGGNGAFFLLLDEPEVYGLPPDPVVPTRDAVRMWKFVGAAAGAFLAAAVGSFLGRR